MISLNLCSFNMSQYSPVLYILTEGLLDPIDVTSFWLHKDTFSVEFGVSILY